ncbi:hypothetical protein AAVH_24305 [Aphelenchoides avenae]|nr:hypothetical protein AAVH_24305 [Aphelenchus avenae]
MSQQRPHVCQKVQFVAAILIAAVAVCMLGSKRKVSSGFEARARRNCHYWKDPQYQADYDRFRMPVNVDFSDIQYSAHWPRNATNIESFASTTADLVLYTKSTKAMSIDYDELLSPHAEYWLEVDEDGRIYYFTLFDTISEHVFRISANSKSTKTGLDFPRAVFPNRTICNLAEVPDVYKTLFEKIYLVTGMAGHLKAPSTPLCYTGLELTRDSFELYVRLIYHLEYLAHCIAAYQWGLDVGYDPFPTQLEQPPLK